jgi:surface antigen
MGRVLKISWSVCVLCAAALPALAHEILAAAETTALSEADRRAAAKAERDALDRDEVIRSFPWQGPDGASGLIIVTGQHPDSYGLGRCRNLIHIIRYRGDGGVNPTFEGKVCRDWEGKWSTERR